MQSSLLNPSLISSLLFGVLTSKANRHLDLMNIWLASPVALHSRLMVAPSSQVLQPKAQELSLTFLSLLPEIQLIWMYPWPSHCSPPCFLSYLKPLSFLSWIIAFISSLVSLLLFLPPFSLFSPQQPGKELSHIHKTTCFDSIYMKWPEYGNP